jgi:pimeloyl-ACP methyl ester carboxylesterase
MWEPQLSAWDEASAVAGLNRRWRVLAPALPGFDGSDPGEATIDAYARQVLGLLDAQQAAAATICGLSMGAYVAFALVRMAAPRVAGLVLADTRSGADTEQARAGRHRMLGLLSTGGAAAVAGDLLPILVGPTSHAGRPELPGRIRAMIEAQPVETIAAATRAIMARPDSDPLLPSIAVPTLVIVGTEDAMTPPVEAERMHAAIAGSQLARIPGAGHLSNMEDPDAFMGVLTGFLSEMGRP